MNATPNIPQQNSAPQATSVSSFQIAEIKTASREFERLFQDATFRDVSEKSSEENDELIGQALDWRQQTNTQISVDFAEKSQTESNTRRTEQPVARFESAQQGKERAETESKVEKSKIDLAKADKNIETKIVKDSGTSSTENEKSKRNDISGNLAKQENDGAKAVKLESNLLKESDAEVLDLEKTTDMDAEVPENSEAQIEIDLEPDLTLEADPELNDETDLELPEEIEIDGEQGMDPEDSDLEQTQRQNPADAKKLKRAQVASVLGAKVDADEKPVPNGTNNAPRLQNMFTEAKSIQQAEKLGSVTPETDAQFGGEDASGQGSGTGSDLARDHSTETTQPASNVQGVTATGQSSGTPGVFAQQSVQVSSVLEAIWSRVTQFRTRGDSQWSVQIRPDDNTKLELTIKVGTAGLEIQTRMQQGDMGRLMSSWGELQQALSERGVSLKNLESDENFKEAMAAGSDAMGQEQNQASAQFNERETEGENGLDLNNWQSKSEDEEAVRQPAQTTTSSHNGWESWA